MFDFGFRVDEGESRLYRLLVRRRPLRRRHTHLNGRDVTLVSESIAPLDRLQAYAARMGWEFPWVSSLGGEFRYDFGAAFTEEQQTNGADYNFTHVDKPAAAARGDERFRGMQNGVVHHAYSTYARGVEQLMGTFHYLDVAPLGRNEDPENPGAWWHRHDEYAGARDA